jgi:hypothetical protein
MPPHTRAELVPEIVKLRRQQLDSAAKALFGCWTREEEAEHLERADRLALLVRQLDALDEITQRSA